MKTYTIKNGIRYFKKQLEGVNKMERKTYYQSEIYRLEEKLYNMDHPSS